LLESEKNEAFRNEKLGEERLKFFMEERNKNEKSQMEKQSRLVEEH
jgi:hypothetical protein